MPKTTAVSQQLLNGRNTLNLSGDKPAWLEKFLGSRKPAASEPDDPRAYFRERNWDKALVAWKRLLLENPNDKDILTTLAEIHLKKDLKGPAFTLYERVLRMYIDEGRTESAVSLLRKIAEMVPRDPRPAERLVRLLMNTSAANKNTSLEQRYRDLALVELRRMAAQREGSGERELALRYLRTIANLDPRDLRSVKRVVTLLCEEKCTQEAVAFLRGIVNQLLKRKLVVPAEKMIQEALRLDNGNPAMLALYFLSQAIDGSSEAARRGMRRLHQQYPDNLDVARIFARLEMELGDSEAVGKWLISAFRMDKEAHSQALIEYGRNMLEAGDSDLAFNAFHTLAEHACRLGHPKKGLSLMNAIFQMDPHHLPTLRALVVCHLRAGDDQDADFFLDLVQEHYLGQDRRLDLAMFLRECLHEFPEHPILKRRLQNMQQVA